MNVKTEHYIPKISKLLNNSWLLFILILSKLIKPCSFNSCKLSAWCAPWTRFENQFRPGMQPDTEPESRLNASSGLAGAAE